jgi:hypothetical protein
MTPCSFVAGYPCFRGMHCLHLQGLQMEAIHTSKTMAAAYKTTWCHNPKDYSSYTQLISIIKQYTTSVADNKHASLCMALKYHFIVKVKGL